MRKVIVISTRYSVISKTKRGSVLASESLTMHDYANKINNYERLQERQDVFSRLTASSIENLDTSGVEVFWQVLISDVLPRENLEFLLTRLKKVEEVSDVKTRISIIESGLASQQNKEVFSNMNKALNSYIDEVISNNGVDTVYGSVRLDDDDCLSSDYALSLLKYMKPEFAGFPVSFPYGYQGVFKEGRISDVRHLYIPKIALGLALINSYLISKGFISDIKNAYMLGNHTHIDQDSAILMDSTKQYYFRTISSSNDSGEIAFHTSLPELCRNEIGITRFYFLNLDLIDYSDCKEDHYSKSEIKKRMSSSFPSLAKARSDIRSLKERKPS